MASSDPPAAGGGGGGEASSVAAGPSVEPLPPSSSSSKRRWSPCTWRYAIEDVQPELGSRPRNSNNNSNSNPLYSASSLRASSEHSAPPTASKSRLHPPQDHLYGKDSEEPLRRSSYGNRTWGSTELSELRAKQAQPRAHDNLSRKKRPPHPQSSHQQQQKESAKRRSPKEDEEDEEDDEEEDDGDDDAELGHHFEEGKKRKKREMSPSELYYCEICRAKIEATKGNITSNSPPPPSDDP